MSFDKDAWILDAIAKRQIVPREDGSVWRFAGVVDGKRTYQRIKVSTHKKSGRVYFNLTHAGLTKSVLVNRVIGLAFLPNPKNLPEVNHIDGDKANNAKSNLEWADRSEQERHAFATGLKATRGSSNANAKLTTVDVERIRASTRPAKVLAEELGISVRTINDIQRRRTWTHV